MPDESDELERLELERKKAELFYRKMMGKKLQVAQANLSGHLIPKELVKTWIGYFRDGVANNFLVLPDAISDGDIGVKERAQVAVKKAIEKTLADADRQLRDDETRLRDSIAHLIDTPIDEEIYDDEPTPKKPRKKKRTVR